jgi:predicted dehydrogenase
MNAPGRRSPNFPISQFPNFQAVGSLARRSRDFRIRAVCHTMRLFTAWAVAIMAMDSLAIRGQVMAQERVIVVGAGGISNAWFPPLKAEELQVAAVVDLRREAAQSQLDKYEIKGAIATDDLDKTLRDVKADFVIDLTIPDAHCSVTCKALAAGFPVIGEKPMAASMDQARKMVAASEKSGKLYMVSQSRRWDSLHETVARTVAAGAPGTLTTMNCDFYIGAHFGGFRDEMASPLILDMAIHHFDLARMFSKTSGVSVYAEEFNPKGSWYKGDVAANCLFEMTSGVRFAYRGSWCAEGCHSSWNGDWRIIGDRGTLLYAGDQMPYGQVVTVESKDFMRPLGPMPISAVKIAKGGMHGGLAEMLNFLRHGTKPQTECHDNIQSLAMVFAAIESSRTGKRVKVADV